MLKNVLRKRWTVVTYYGNRRVEDGPQTYTKFMAKWWSRYLNRVVPQAPLSVVERLG